MNKIGIIVGSIREGRVGLRVAKWVANAVARRGEVHLLDLRDYPLPLFDEAASPRFNPNRTPVPAIQRWLSAIAACDGFVIVSPEYNGSMPGVLKNAIDCIGTELEDKPCAVVTYGARGGSQATIALRAALPMIGGVLTQRSVYFAHYDPPAIISDDGVMDETAGAGPWGPQTQIDALAEEIVRVTSALSPVRPGRSTG